MNINRHNYESYFLLYVDNELSATERNVVDLFVAENPDLHQELMHLLQTVIDPAMVVFEHKENLLKAGGLAVLQENLLLYLDNELNATARQDMEKQITADVTAYREFNILRQTKLEATPVIFTDKSSLYRSSGARVIAFRWWRAAAAVLLLGFGLWTGVTVYRYNFSIAKVAETVANNDDNTQNNSNDKQKVQTAETMKQAAADSFSKNSSMVQTVMPATSQNSLPLQNTTKRAVENKDVEPAKIQVSPKNKQQENMVSNKPSNNLPKSYLENINDKGSNETITRNVTPKNANNSNENSGNNTAVVQGNSKEKTNNTVNADINTNVADPKSTAALQAVYDPNKAANSNDRFLEMDDKAKRTKVGGFFRKVKRVLERTANIKTGDEVKVAGFAIAIK